MKKGNIEVYILTVCCSYNGIYFWVTLMLFKSSVYQKRGKQSYTAKERPNKNLDPQNWERFPVQMSKLFSWISLFPLQSFFWKKDFFSYVLPWGIWFSLADYIGNFNTFVSPWILYYYSVLEISQRKEA